MDSEIKDSNIRRYLSKLDEDRRATIMKVREVVKSALQPGFEEIWQYRMIGYVVPHSLYPKGYHCNPKEPLPFIHLAAQKNYFSLYLFCFYADPEAKKRFVDQWQQQKPLKMGKSCVRFKSIDDVPVDVVRRMLSAISPQDYIDQYESVISAK